MAATHPEILARVERLEMKASAVEKAAGLPQAFLSKAGAGGCGSAKAAGSWAKLLTWLDEKEAAIGLAPKKAAPVAPSSAVAQPPPQDVPHDLADEIDAAHTYDEIGAVLAKITSAVARGLLDRNTAKVLGELLRERRQVIKLQVEERLRIDSRKPLTVNVVWRSDWREKIAANQAEDEAEDA